MLQVLPGDLVATDTLKGINIWDLKSQEITQTLSANKGTVKYLLPLPNGLLASAFDDNTIKIWVAKKGL